LWNGIALALTLVCVLIAWVFFRAKNFTTAGAIVTSMFWQPPGSRMSSHDLGLLPWMAGLGAVVLLLPNSQALIERLRTILTRVRVQTRAHELLAFLAGTEVVAIVLLALIAARRESTEFIYFNF